MATATGRREDAAPGQQRHQSPTEAEGAGGVPDERQAEGAHHVHGAIGQGGQGPRLGELVEHDDDRSQAEHQAQPPTGADLTGTGGRARVVGRTRLAVGLLSPAPERPQRRDNPPLLQATHSAA